MTGNTEPCPKCGRTEDWWVYADEKVDTYPYSGDDFRGIGIWCNQCREWVDDIFLTRDDLINLVERLWKEGKLDEYV